RMVVFPENLTTDSEASYVVTHGSANSISMTRWEAEERAKADERAGKERPEDWNHEGVGWYISHPIDELEFRLKLPISLADVQPYLRCDRLQGFPDFKINDFGDAEIPPAPVFDIDTGMEIEEGRAPQYDPEDDMWHLLIHRPVVGYRY